MWVHPQFNPIAFSVGPLSVHWYGLMYLVGFAFFYLLGRIREKEKWRGMSGEDALEDLLFYGILGCWAAELDTASFISRPTLSSTRSKSSRYGRAA